MTVNAIVAVYADGGIGADGTQPVTLRADRKRFREATMGAAVIVGRKTLADFPGGKPLPGRENIILTAQDIAIPGAEVVHSVSEAVTAAEKHERCFVIGGAGVYQAMLPYIHRVLVTHIDLTPASDSFFPDLAADPGWECAEDGPWQEENGIRYRFCEYRRRP